MGDVTPQEVMAYILVLFLGIGLHEYAHCKVADMCGDDTARLQGRVTLNLFKHFEPMGTFMMVFSSFTGLGLGWGRAAPIDPRRLRDPRWDLFAAVAAGPLSNLLQAVIYGLIFRVLIRVAPEAVSIDSFLFLFLQVGVFINLRLMLFNLIPFGPLDGHWLVGQLLPEKQRYYWYQFNRTVGMFGLLIVITILNQAAPGVLYAIIGRPAEKLFYIITGL
jgi:Zn-dependent protease